LPGILDALSFPVTAQRQVQCPYVRVKRRHRCIIKGKRRPQKASAYITFLAGPTMQRGQHGRARQALVLHEAERACRPAMVTSWSLTRIGFLPKSAPNGEIGLPVGIA